jgi:tRNA/rRNA methyltransferase
MSSTLEILLMEPEEGGNLGSICRALKTLGYPPPKLIAAPEGIERSPEARRLAHGAREYLEEVERYENLEAVADTYDLIVGTTARRRRTVTEYLDLRELPGLLRRKGSSAGRVAILFGSEASGLPSSVLKKCDLISTVPLRTSYPSLNLAQAVLLYAYELSPLMTDKRKENGKRVPGGAGAEAAGPAYRALLERIVRLLSEREVNEPLIGRVRERLAHVEEGDVSLIHSVLNALEQEPGSPPSE